MELDQAIDRRTAATACPPGTASFANLVAATRARIDALPNRSVVDRMAVANQHAFCIAREKLQIKFNSKKGKNLNEFRTVLLFSRVMRGSRLGLERAEASLAKEPHV